MNANEVAKAVELACLVEVLAPKPGNVNRHFDFADTTYEDFIFSAWACGSSFQRAEELSVGELILAAGRATGQVAGGNTNLGILLLLAPLAKAALAPGPQSLRDKVQGVLAGLTRADARLVYTAIREAKAGGLGRVEEADVAQEPDIPLGEAMELAQNRDSIAAEYCNGFHYTFTCGVPALQAALDKYDHWALAVVEAFLVVLATTPDTLIARKAGWEKAVEVSRRAQGVLAAGALDTFGGKQALITFDGYLRKEGNRLNPGTTADLMAASLLVFFFTAGYGRFFARKGGNNEF